MIYFEYLPLILGVSCLVGAGVAYFLYIHQPNSSRIDKVEISLAKLARDNWVDDKDVVEVLPPVSSRTLPQFQSKEIADFYQTRLAKYIETALYSEVIGKSLDAIIKILLLLDLEGNCPSIVDRKGDPELDSYGSFYELLRKVSLRVHSLNVAEECVTILTQQYKEPEFMFGRVLVAALGHDLGKIDKFSKGSTGLGYSLGYHPNVSAAIVEPFLADVNGKEEILSAIRDHHHNSSANPLLQIIREADRRAREREISALTGRAVIDPKMLSWIKPEELLEEIEKSINVTNTGGHFDAFSHKGIVYVPPFVISKAVILLCKKYDVLLGDKTDCKTLEVAVVHSQLKEFWAEEIGDGYPARVCNVKQKEEKPKRLTLTPLKSEAFKTPLAELEQRKDPGIIEIESVKMLAVKRNK